MFFFMSLDIDDDLDEYEKQDDIFWQAEDGCDNCADDDRELHDNYSSIGREHQF